MAPSKAGGAPQPPDAGEVLQRLGISDVQARQSKTLELAWKGLTPPDAQLTAALLPTAYELVELDLRHNRLGDQGCGAIIDGLRHAVSRDLAILRLARNGIADRGGAAIAKFLADAGASSSLRVLDLSLNALRDGGAIGGALRTNTVLTELDLTSNAIRGGKAIAAGLTSNRTLVHTNLLFNRLDLDSAYELASVTRSSRAHGVPRTLCGVPPDAEAVNLPRRGMSSSDGILLAAELETAACVRSVDLSHNALGPQAAAALGDALRASTTLTSLNLQNNRLAGMWMTFGDEVGWRDDNGVVSLASALCEGAPSLTSLNLSGNTLGEAGARAVARAAATAHQAGGDVPSLRWLHVGGGGEALPVQQLRGSNVHGGEGHSSLSLGGRQLDDLDAVVISQLIHANTRLTTLDLSGASIGGVGCAALANALCSATCSLTKLDLRGRAMLGETGKLAIGAALLAPDSARVGCLACEAFTLGAATAALDLPGTTLSDGDISLLAGVIRHNVALLSLDLSHTALGASSCASLCNALAKNSALRELDVYGNELSDEGAKHIAEVLRVNSTLTALSVGMNQMSGEGVRRVTHALDGNSSLVALALDNNGASYFTEVHGERMLSSNRRMAAMRRHLPSLANGELVAQTRLTVHLCGEPGCGKTALSGALRRSGVGQKAVEGEGQQQRNRGVVQLVHRYESRTFEVTDYGGKTEFAMMHHRHHDRNARAVMAPAVYLVIINLSNGVEQCAAELRWWRRLIRSSAPRGQMPVLAVIGSRADRCPKGDGKPILNAVRAIADQDGTELPEIAAAFQFDCRGAAWPLRDWYVAQHDSLVGNAPPVPMVVDAVRERKAAWMEKETRLRVLSWGDLCQRLRKEVPALAKADDHTMRALGFYLHDAGALLVAEMPPATDVVVLDLAWFYTCIVVDLIDTSPDRPRHKHNAGMYGVASSAQAQPAAHGTAAAEEADAGPQLPAVAPSPAADEGDERGHGAAVDGEDAAEGATSGAAAPEEVDDAGAADANGDGEAAAPERESLHGGGSFSSFSHGGSAERHVAALSAAEIGEYCRCAPQLGENGSLKLAHFLCELGMAAPCADRSSEWDDTAYILPPPLTNRAAPIRAATREAAYQLRGQLPVQAGRRFVGRSADDMLLVPVLLARLHARAAAEPAAFDEPGDRPIIRDGDGRLLLGRYGSVCVVELIELPDGRDAIDVFACAERPGALPYAMLSDALELLRLCTHECCPGAQSVIHVIGERGLDETVPAEHRPTSPIGVVRAACKANKPTVHFGGMMNSVLKLLGDEEVRSIQLSSPPSPPKEAPKPAAPASPPAEEPKPPKPPKSKAGRPPTPQQQPGAPAIRLPSRGGVTVKPRPSTPEAPGTPPTGGGPAKAGSRSSTPPPQIAANGGGSGKPAKAAAPPKAKAKASR